MKEEQVRVFEIRMDLVHRLEETHIPELSKENVTKIDDELK